MMLRISLDCEEAAAAVERSTADVLMKACARPTLRHRADGYRHASHGRCHRRAFCGAAADQSITRCLRASAVAFSGWAADDRRPCSNSASRTSRSGGRCPDDLHLLGAQLHARTEMAQVVHEIVGFDG